MQTGATTLVPPFDDPLVIAGQGTIGLELAEQVPDADLALIPVGGGGLISGIATALKGCGRASRSWASSRRRQAMPSSRWPRTASCASPQANAIADGVAARPSAGTFSDHARLARRHRDGSGGRYRPRPGAGPDPPQAGGRGLPAPLPPPPPFRSRPGARPAPIGVAAAAAATSTSALPQLLAQASVQRKNA